VLRCKKNKICGAACARVAYLSRKIWLEEIF